MDALVFFGCLLDLMLLLHSNGIHRFTPSSSAMVPYLAMAMPSTASSAKCMLRGMQGHAPTPMKFAISPVSFLNEPKNVEKAVSEVLMLTLIE